MKSIKRILSAATALSLAFCALAFDDGQKQSANAAQSDMPYAQALQMSLFFYECQQAGNLPEWNRVSWRDDATTDDFIDGGWYDAGDHVKFNLPMAYSASMLAWGMYAYPDGIEQIGQWEIYQNNLEFVLDYLVDCNLGDSVVYQVGTGQKDHTWWGPVELYYEGLGENSNGVYEREYYTTTDSAVVGEMAAALAAGACALEGRSNKCDEYIETAKHYFEIASTTLSDDSYNDSDASGFYRSSHFYDELFYAANWLYIATGEQSYLDAATGFIPNLGLENGTSELKYSWAQCWDDVQQGGTLLYAINTGDSTWKEQVRKHLEYWVNSSSKVDGVLCYADTWGCLRYACNIGFIAAVACDELFYDDSRLDVYTELYESQIDYALGDNPNNQCYVVGLDETSPINAHHRTAHASWNNSLDNPTENRHILYGALVGGPTQSGEYVDDRGNYINNEVATDYNAGFTALLCKMVDKYGGQTDPDFPQEETPDTEIYVEAKLSKTSASGVDLSFKLTNHTAWPARIVDDISYRYYMDLTEVIEAGYSATDITMRCDRDQATMYSNVTPATYSLNHYKDNIYYVEITYADGRAAMPISEGRHQCEFMLAIVFPNYQSGWNAQNDYSNTELLENVGEYVVSDYITVYNSGKLIYGTEPDGTSAETPSDPVEPTLLYGDANGDGIVNSIDATIVTRAALGAFELSDEAQLRCDVNGDGKVNSIDATIITRYALRVITSFPVESK